MSLIENFFKKSIKVRLPLYFLLLMCSVFAVIYLNHLIANFIGDYAKDVENLYWLFSASAQSIATFFAFILAGYTIFVSMMNDGFREKDDSLIEIIEEEKRTIFKKIKVLSIIVGFSLLMNLTMIYVNGSNFDKKTDLVIITILSTILAVILGVWIVVIIINPKKNKQIAEKLIYKDKRFNQSGSKRNEQEFFSAFIEFEKKLRDYITNYNVYVKSKQPQFPSFRDIISTFYYTKMIDGRTYEELLELNKYRNLLFHGHINEASETMVEKVTNFNETLIDKLKEQK